MNFDLDKLNNADRDIYGQTIDKLSEEIESYKSNRNILSIQVRLQRIF